MEGRQTFTCLQRDCPSFLRDQTSNSKTSLAFLGKPLQADLQEQSSQDLKTLPPLLPILILLSSTCPLILLCSWSHLPRMAPTQRRRHTHPSVSAWPRHPKDVGTAVTAANLPSTTDQTPNRLQTLTIAQEHSRYYPLSSPNVISFRRFTANKESLKD